MRRARPSALAGIEDAPNGRGGEDVKTLFLIALAASMLGGCVVAPAYPDYPSGYSYGPGYVYASPGPYYRHGYYGPGDSN